MAISHAFTNPVPDGTITSIVRPSDWNSAHNQYYTLLGNTLGNSTVSGTNIVFQGAGNVSLSGTGHTIVVYGTGGGGGTQSVQTQASGGIAGTGFTSTTTAGTAVVGTLNSQGLSLGVPAYVTNAVGGGGVAIAGGTQTATSGTVNFANSNGITFGMSGSNQITASHNGITSQSVQTQASGNIAGSGFSSTTTAGTAIVGTNNSNGLSLGVPAYLTTQSVQTQASGNIARTGFTSTTTAGTAVVGTLNTGGLSLGVPAYLTTQSVQTQASGNIAGSGFTGANATGTLNSNGLSLSVAAPGAANYSIGVSNLGNTAGSTGITGTRIVFVGTNNISLSQSTDANGATISINQTGGGGGPTAYVASLNGSTGSISLNVGSSLSSSTNGSSITFGLASNITTALQSANANYLTSQSNQAFSASGGSSTFQTLNFANSNGVTFSNSGGSVVASYTVPTVPTAYVSSVNGSSGAISLNVGSSLSASTNGSSITFGLASNITTALQSTGNYLTTARASNDAVGLNTAATNVTWTVNSSGISLNAAGYAGTNTSANNASLTLNSNGLTISVAAPGGGAGNFNLSGATSGNTTASGSTINLSGINITLSGTNGSQIAISAPATSSLSAGNNFSISTNGSTIGLSAQAVAAAAGTQTATSGTVNFANSNGITFGMSGSSQITASYTVPSTTGFAGTGFTSTTVTGTAVQGTLSTNGLSLAVPAYLTAAAGGNFSGGVSNLGNTAGSTGITGTRIVFVGTNNISLSQSTDANGATISINQTGGGGGLTNINVSAGTTSNNLSNIIFSNGNGVTFGLNGSTVTASVAPQYTLSGYNHYNDVVQSIGAVGQGSLIFDHIDLENAIQFDRYGLMIFNTNPTNSSGSHTISFWVGLYTQNVSTISLLQSTSTSVNVSQSGTIGSYSLFSGVRQLTVPFTTTLTQGEYFLGVVSRSTSAGANGSYSQLQQSNVNSDYRGLWGAAVNATNQVFPGVGFYSTTTSGLPGSIAFSQINGTAAGAFRPPVVIFQSGTY